jgi:hypothetical protein
MKVEMMGDSELNQVVPDERFVGQGERATLKIIQSIFGDQSEYKIQYPFKRLMKGDYLSTLSERQERETLDIIVFRFDKPTIVVRVQDKHHDGILKSSQDLVQKQMLEWNNCIVVDVWYRDCPTVWTEEVNEESIKEITECLRSSKVI